MCSCYDEVKSFLINLTANLSKHPQPECEKLFILYTDSNAKYYLSPLACVLISVEIFEDKIFFFFTMEDMTSCGPTFD